MTPFQVIKTTLTVQQVAIHYGLPVNRNGMTRCPFHDDHEPSLKLNDRNYYCFACGAKGDVIAFTSKLFNITASAAAQKLYSDFDLHEQSAKLQQHKTQARLEPLCVNALRDYLKILQDWRVRFQPQTPDEDLDDRFVEACRMQEGIQYFLHQLTTCSQKERYSLITDMTKDNKLKLL